MIFTVPKNFKGSFVLNTLNRALSKGMTVSISGNDLYASDIKMAISQGKCNYNSASPGNLTKIILNST